MPAPIDRHTSQKSQASLRLGRFRLRLLIAATLLPALRVSANCPDPTAPVEDPESTFSTLDPSTPIDVESDSAEATRDGQVLLQGEVTMRQGPRTMRTRDAEWNQVTSEFTVENGVEYQDPNLMIRGAGAHLDPGTGAASFTGAEFELPAINARGAADHLRATSAGEVELDNVRYTTCPVGNEDWLLSASEIDISQERGLGTGRNVRLDFKGIPIMYVPYFSFPVGDERKSGFLYPSFGGYSRDGLSFPWYWNIAPNADATLIPTWDYRRGAKLDTEWRYLWPIAEGIVETQWLPDDQQYGEDRSFVHFVNRSDFTDSLRLDLNAANASDDQWFEDFGQGPEGTSVTYLSRSAQLSLLTEHWMLFARAQNFQTIDGRIAETDRPFTVLPQLGVRGWMPDQAFGLTFGFDGELANFAHTIDDPDIVETGARLDVAPQIRMPLRAAGVYLEPAAAWRYTAYELDHHAPGTHESRTRSAPLLSVDGGLSFERVTGSRAQRLQTFEPRFMYLYVPYRNQDDLPIFDTATADLNLVQLFRTNRYVGGDRLSDANQLSFGVTSRLLDSENGKQFIAGTIGQAYYFRTPRVTLPGEAFDDTESSDIIGELDLTAYENWNIHMGVQWDPGETRSERGDVQLQYRPDYDKVINLGYRFRRGIIETSSETTAGSPAVMKTNLEQVDGSIAWPIGEQWGAYARLVYSLDDEQTLDQFAGFEYRSCCWRLRLVGRRYVRSRDGDMDTSILLQLELNGLSSVGTGADTFLERSIRGYSPRAREDRASP